MTLFFGGEVCILKREKRGLRVIFSSRLNTRAFSKINICGWSRYGSNGRVVNILPRGKSWKRIELFIWLNVYAARIIFFSPSCLDRFTSDRCNIAFKEREGLFTRLALLWDKHTVLR